MKRNLQINNILEDDSTELFSRLRIPWKHSKEEIWNEVSKQIHSPKIISMKSKIIRWQMAVAAILIISLSIGFFMRTYTLSYKSLAGLYINTELPDGSKVYLNAGSELSYQPYWWWAGRKVNLQGEAFFNVEKGKTFSVVSENGSTEVLGTSFNVFARGQRYEVICVSGKVKVQAALTQHTVILHPAQKANLLKTGQLKIDENVNTENSKAWMSNRLVFTSIPLVEVFEEIERQYKVEILLPSNLSQHYTGSFDKPKSAGELLRIVCRPFDLKVVKKSNEQFLISK